MPGDDPSIIGSRVADGDYLSVREAVKMFASKDELVAMNTALQGVQSTVAQLPTRAEAAARAEGDTVRLMAVKETAEQTRDEFRSDLRDVKLDIKALRSNQLPPWAIPAIGAIITAAALIGPHIWK